MFHVQLRQFPHLARAFNLTAEELHSRVLEPWTAGRHFQLQDRSWDPQRARLTVIEGPELEVQEIGMGRGWASAARAGSDVTSAVLAQPQADSETLKVEIAARCGSEPMTLSEVVARAGSDGMRASARLALAEQAVWELLHAGAVRLTRQGAELPRDAWQPTLVGFSAWHDPALALERSGDDLGDQPLAGGI
ncbi:MAG: hypothetical protein M3076_05540 [Actinomycetota bacterium]|nr:hypothetical protein [Actinomycetota bacterium]